APTPGGRPPRGMPPTVPFEARRGAPAALHVSSSALRLRPPENLLAERPAAASARRPAPAPSTPSDGNGASERREPGTLYVLTPDSRLHAIAVLTGISDGILTVVEAPPDETLAEGTEVVTAVLTDQASTTNPFGPPQMGAPRGVR